MGAAASAGENAGRSPGAASRDRDLYLQVSLSELTSTEFTARGGRCGYGSRMFHVL